MSLKTVATVTLRLVITMLFWTLKMPIHLATTKFVEISFICPRLCTTVQKSSLSRKILNRSIFYCLILWIQLWFRLLWSGSVFFLGCYDFVSRRYIRFRSLQYIWHLLRWYRPAKTKENCILQNIFAKIRAWFWKSNGWNWSAQVFNPV